MQQKMVRDTNVKRELRRSVERREDKNRLGGNDTAASFYNNEDLPSGSGRNSPAVEDSMGVAASRQTSRQAVLDYIRGNEGRVGSNSLQ